MIRWNLEQELWVTDQLLQILVMRKYKTLSTVKLKKREMFRPFAPAILGEKKNEWFNNNHPNPYMSAVEEINKDKRNLIPAVTHIDGTGRVQTVTREINRNFYNLIEKFYQLTSVPILLKHF